MNKLIIIAIALMYSTHLLAWCSNLNLLNIPSQVNLNNDISPVTNFQITRTTHSSSCRYRVGITKGTSSSYNRNLYSGINSIGFSLAKNNSMSKVLMDIYDANSSSNYFKGRFKANKGSDTRSHGIYAELDLTGNEAPGFYSDQFDIKVYQEFGPFNLYYGSWPITYTYSIPENIAVSLVETNAPFDAYDNSQDLSFGTLVQGSQKGFDIVIQSNTGYILNVSSLNNGKLKHQQVNTYIDYLFSVNGQPTSLAGSSSAGLNISNGTGSYSSDGFRVPILVEVGDTTNKVAGVYEDHLTITVTTNL
jgi:spore coat protein U-like protein